MSVYNFIIIDYWNIPTWKATSLRVTRTHSRIRAVGNTGYIKFFMGIHSRAGQLIGFYWTTINVITPWYIIYIYIYLSIYHSPSLHSFSRYFFFVAHWVVYKLWFIVVCVCVLARLVCALYGLPSRGRGCLLIIRFFFCRREIISPFFQVYYGCPPL